VGAACGGQPVAVVSHSSPSPSPVADYGPPPEGVPLFYVPDPHQEGWYVGIDWSGIPRGTVKFEAPPGPGRNLAQAPDGSAFFITQLKAQGHEYFDRLGRPVADPDPTIYHSSMWADDSKQLCSLAWNSTAHWRIGLKSPGVVPALRAVALDPLIAGSGIVAIDFRGCSPSRDRAVLAYNYFGRPTDVYAVRLSDGAILLHQTHAANLLADIMASSDAALIAENSSKSSGYIAGPTAPDTTIRRLSDGSVVATLDPTYGVLAFSRDDSLALVSTSPWASGVATHLALIRLSDAGVLWRYGGDEELFSVWVRPDGQDIAIMLQAPGSTLTMSPVDVVIVHPDGSATSQRLPSGH
jgi:hypothetical protein